MQNYHQIILKTDQNLDFELPLILVFVLLDVKKYIFKITFEKIILKIEFFNIPWRSVLYVDSLNDFTRGYLAYLLYINMICI